MKIKYKRRLSTVKKSRIILLFYTAVMIAMCFTGLNRRNAQANSAYIPPINDFDISVEDDGADISVSSELLVFDFLSTNSSNKAKVSATYIMDSPADKAVYLGFPLESSLAALNDEVSVEMNEESLSYDIHMLYHENYMLGYFQETGIDIRFADLTFEQQLQSAISKTYNSQYRDRNGWLYKIDDNFYGNVAYSADFAVLFGDIAYSYVKDGNKTLLVSGGGYIFSEQRISLTGILTTQYTEEECLLGDFQNTVFPIDYYSEAAFLYDAYYSATQGGPTMSLNKILDNFLTCKRSLMLVYQAPFAAGKNTMTVRYNIEGIAYSSDTFKYYTNPAKLWKSFGDLTVRIDAYGNVTNCNIPLKHQKLEKTEYYFSGSPYIRSYNRYEYTGTLPRQNLSFSFGKTTTKTNYQLISIALLYTVILIIVLSILTVTFIVKYRRAKKLLKNYGLQPVNNNKQE